MKTFSATVKSCTRFNSWWIIAMPSAPAVRGLQISTGRPSQNTWPEVPVDGRRNNLQKRRLTRPVLAEQAVDLAGANLNETSTSATAPK